MSHPTQPQYGTPQPAPGPAAPARNGLGTAALVLGVIGTISGFIPLFFWLAGILGLIALILGLSGRGRVKRGEATNKGVTTTGAILGLAALILSVVGAVITYKAVDEAVTELNKELGNTAPKETTGEAGTGTDTGAGSGDGTDGAKVPEVLGADETVIYDDDLKITISAAKAYKPTESALDHTEGNKAYMVTVVIENGGKEKFNADLVTLEARAGANGVAAPQIYDDGLDDFTGTIVPGKKATTQYAFDAPADAKTLTVEVSPGLEHEAHQWELKL
ncbi:DUF4352 domain-containing protein [Streptomyces sp. TRM49041]|uniref:DUF4352 domain-containing protein n=1 Tax=Streptomyces sp. TRM49041 TaxID=2603216 RepID=UPI0011EC6766|nr:DUF4352 domain-containing protein [Streptomyces sp. TRM49041]